MHLFFFLNVDIKSCFCISIHTISYHQLAAVCLIPLGAVCSVSDQTCSKEYVTLQKRLDLKQLNIEKGIFFTESYLNKGWFSI